MKAAAAERCPCTIAPAVAGGPVAPCLQAPGVAYYVPACALAVECTESPRSVAVAYSAAALARAVAAGTAAATGDMP
eukprot:scaffold68212_cov31-Tisochrysis_lutea.AAC.5